jgi:hypothetical protein
MLESLHFALDRREKALHLASACARVLCKLLFEHFDVQPHRRQWVSDLVGHVGRHLSDGREPLVRESELLGSRNPRDHPLESGFELADLVVARCDFAGGKVAASDRLRPLDQPRER